MPSQPEAQGDILKEFREGTFLSSLDMCGSRASNEYGRSGSVNVIFFLRPQSYAGFTDVSKHIRAGARHTLVACLESAVLQRR